MTAAISLSSAGAEDIMVCSGNHDFFSWRYNIAFVGDGSNVEHRYVSLVGDDG